MTSILAIDYGEKRIGLALASREASLPSPYKTLINSPTLLQELQAIISKEQVVQLVVGLPRNLEGDDTAQTARTRRFADSLQVLGLPIGMIDEAGTSHQAKLELAAAQKPYAKGDIDMLAACYILQDYLNEEAKNGN